MTLSGKFLCRSKMIIPFSGKYHVPDSNDWGSSSCPSLVAPRSAKRRRTESTIHTRRSRWFAESVEKLRGEIRIMVGNMTIHTSELQMSAKEVFYCLELVCLALLQSP